MTDEQLTEFAQGAYHAHCEARDFKNLKGEPLWTWDEMPEFIQQSWKAAVNQVIADLNVRDALGNPLYR